MVPASRLGVETENGSTGSGSRMGATIGLITVGVSGGHTEGDGVGGG